MSAVRKDPSPAVDAAHLRGLIRQINRLGRHVRHGNITEYEARILLGHRYHGDGDGPPADVLDRINDNLDRILYSTPLKQVRIRWDDRQDNLAIDVRCRVTTDRPTPRDFTI